MRVRESGGEARGLERRIDFQANRRLKNCS